MAELIDVEFGLWTWVGQMKHVLHWHIPANAIEPSVYVGDAALCQLTLPTCFNYCSFDTDCFVLDL